MSCHLCGRGIVGQCGCEPLPVGELTFAEPTLDQRRKADDEITVSAGRKRAAREYPIDREAPCEWRGLANAGGGKIPIVGCIDGKQQDLQHGPVKATYRNERSNIHKICKKCHNRWHSANDPVYNEEEYDKLPHNPRPASPEELMQNELNWSTGKYASILRAQILNTGNSESIGEGILDSAT